MNNDNIIEKTEYQQDDLTLVTAYYKVKSTHTHNEFKEWIKNFVKLNKSIVFFSSKKFKKTLEALRPKRLYNKTVFINMRIKDFYTYKNFFNDFHKSFHIDVERNIHSIPLFMVWAEKCMFLKKIIERNYFRSKCFYWVDIGYFRENKSEMQRYLHNWPNTEKCYEDNRLVLGQVKYFSNIEKLKLIKFDREAHEKLQRDINVAGGFFVGQIKNTLLFIQLYYETIRLFINKKLFIGKDQNIFTYIAFKHPEIVKLFYSDKNYYYLKKYFC